MRQELPAQGMERSGWRSRSLARGGTNGVHLNIRLDEEKLCRLVLVGVRVGGGTRAGCGPALAQLDPTCLRPTDLRSRRDDPRSLEPPAWFARS
jgi:hypothetical protein